MSTRLVNAADGRRPGTPRRFLWTMLGVVAVFVTVMWVTMARSVSGFDALVESQRGTPFDDLSAIAGSDAGSARDWVESSPGSWLADPSALDGDGAGAGLTRTGRAAGEPILAVTPVPAEWDHRYTMSFSVAGLPSASVATNGVVLAASDSRNYVALNDRVARRQWTFGEVVGGKATTYFTTDDLTLRVGDRVTVNFIPPTLTVLVNEKVASTVALDEPTERFWVGFLADSAGFAVSNVKLSAP